MSSKFLFTLRPVAAVVMAVVTLSDLQATVLEEVVVTARIRAENLQSVPASVAALGGDKLFESGIDKIEDFEAYVPNLAMSETGIGTNLYMRGIGSGINQGFEQSVGMYVDGVYYGRAQLTRAPFMDLQRIEALRGPQNILYGKNSIAGAISQITNRPGDEFEGLVSVSHEPDNNEQVYDVVLSGPLSDKAGARLAYRKRDADGYIDNLTLDRDEPERDEDTIRAMFTFDVSDNFDYTLKYEHGTFNTTGRQIEIINDQPSTSASPFFAGRTWGQILDATTIALPSLPSPTIYQINSDASVRNNTLDYDRSSNGDYSDNTTDNVTFTANYTFNENTLQFITGYLTYDYEELCDCDFTGASIFDVSSQEDYEQISQEVRFISPKGGELEFITGAYYQNSDQDFKDSFQTLPVTQGNPVVPSFTGASYYSNVFNLTGSAALSGLAATAAYNAVNNIAVPRNFSQDTELWSLFAQATWNIQTDLRLNFGGRYTREEKEGARELTYVGGTTGTVVGPLGVIDSPAVLSKAFKVDAVGHNLKDDRNENNFAPQVVFEYDLNSDMMAYASATKGYKSGGYDARSNAIPGSVNNGTFEYDQEEATSYEIGMKNTLADGAVELNAAYFYTEYTDLQVSIYDGVLGFNVGNAAEAVTQGVEFESRWQATDKLNFRGSLAYLDFEYKDYANGQCPQGFTPDSTIGTNNYCDYKGKSNQYVAPWSANLLTEYVQPLGAGFDLKFNLDLIYSDEYNPTQNLDPRVVQDSYTKINARIGLSGDEGKWDIALVGNNLSDEEIISYANDAPLSYNLSGSVGHYGMIEQGKSVAITGTYRF